MTKKLLCVIVLILVLVCMFASCSQTKGIESATINASGELILTYTDGTVENLGNVKGEQGVQGEKGDRGEKGDKGEPTIEISEDGYWVINGTKTEYKATIQTQTYTVLFYSDESEISSQSVAKGEKATEPPSPKKEGYTFDGWYIGDERWNFAWYTVTEDITLTARWIPINNSQGGGLGPIVPYE